VLSTHVVCTGEHVPEGWPAEHEPLTVGAGDAVGEVGMPAGDRVEGERCDRADDAGDQPVGDAVDVDPRYGAHLTPLIDL
jgi:hypothetical protein